MVTVTMKSRYSLAGKLGAVESAKTASLRKQQRIQAYDLEPKLCKFCVSPIAYDQRRNDFCGHSCAASVTNKGVRRSKLKPPPCRLCCTTLKRNASKFCSHTCQQKFTYDAFITAWKAGVEVGGSWSHVSSYVRKWLIAEFGEKCSKCGWSERHTVTQRVPVQVDHIDGDPNNHRPENLRLLCPNCHSLTATYGGLNRGRGRKERYLSDSG